MGRRLRELAKAEITRSIAADEPLPYRERYVLLALSNELRDSPGETWTSDAVIAKKLGMSRSGYLRARARLIERGLMARVRGNGQGSHINRYRLFPACAVPEQDTCAVPEQDTCAVPEQDEPLSPAATCADTAATCADTVTYLRGERTYIPERPQRNPATYVVPAAPPPLENEEEQSIENGPAEPAENEIDEEHRREEIRRLTRVASDA